MTETIQKPINQFGEELIIPNVDLPCKLFIWEGRDGNYIREKHWHKAIEIFAVTEGELTFCYEDERRLLQAGDFMLCNSNEIHSVYAPKPNLTFVLQLPVNIFRDFYTSEQFIRFTHEKRQGDKKVMDLVQKIFHNYVERKNGYSFLVQSYFYQLLYILVNEYREVDVEEEFVTLHQKLQKLSPITSYIKQHYQEDMSLESLAETFGYSPTYISKMFQKYAKTNYKAFVEGIRVEHACNDIRNTDLPITEISLKHGFPNGKALIRVLKQKYGMTPSEYRKSVQTSQY